MNKCKVCGCGIKRGDMCFLCQSREKWLSEPEYFCRRCERVMPEQTESGLCVVCLTPKEKSVCLSKSAEFDRQEDLLINNENQEGETTVEVKKAKICLHCKEEKKITGRGLCWKCYSVMDIRNQYQPKPTNRTGINKQLNPTEEPTPPIKHPSPQVTAKHSRVSMPGIGEYCPGPIEKKISLQPLNDLLASRLKYKDELNRQAVEQARILDMKYYEIKVITKLCEDLKETIERMRT